MRRSHLCAASLSVLTLACGGAATPPADATFSTQAPFLVQEEGGVWEPGGARVLALGGAAFADLYVIDASRDAFFLLANEGGVHVARRQGTDFAVTLVRETGRVTRPIGSVAVVEEQGRGLLVDLDGNVVLDGVHVDVAGGQDPPVDQPPYWWLRDYFWRPAPLCLDKGGCGVMGPDGEWVVEPGQRKDVPHYLDAMPMSGRLLEANGTMSDPGFVDFDPGPASEGLCIGTRAVARDVASTGEPDAPVVWVLETGEVHAIEVAQLATGAEVSDGCPGPNGGYCHFAFFESRAMLIARPTRPGPFLQGYIAPDGSVAIPFEACTAPAPSGPFHDGRAFRCIGEEYFLIDADGNRLAGPWPHWDPKDRNHYPEGLFFSEGLAAVPVSGGYAYVDTSGATVLPGPYAVARPFRLGLAAVVQGDALQYIRPDGSLAFVDY